MDRKFLSGIIFRRYKLYKWRRCVVWILSPRRYNWLVLKDSNSVPVASSIYLNNYVLKADAGPEPTRKVEANYPLAMRPIKNSKRILAQRGVFTIHGNQNISLLDFVEDRSLKDISILEKIIVSGKRKLSILQDLYQCGISPSVLFPELPGISEELIMKYHTFLNLNNTSLKKNWLMRNLLSRLSNVTLLY